MWLNENVLNPLGNVLDDLFQVMNVIVQISHNKSNFTLTFIHCV